MKKLLILFLGLILFYWIHIAYGSYTIVGSDWWITTVQSNGYNSYTMVWADWWISTIQSNWAWWYIMVWPNWWITTIQPNSYSYWIYNYKPSIYESTMWREVYNTSYFSGGEFLHRRFKYNSGGCDFMKPNDDCFCSTWYFRDLTQKQCVPLPCYSPDKSFRDLSWTCRCNTGYAWINKDNQCETATTQNSCPVQNSHLWTDLSCWCNDWYTNINNKCVKISSNTCSDINSHLWSGWLCQCNKTYRLDPKDNQCKKADLGCQSIMWPNAIATGNDWEFCTCKTWYTFNKTAWSCILPTKSCQIDYWINSNSSWPANIDGSYQCYCNDGYIRNSNQTSCIRWIINVNTGELAEAISWMYNNWLTSYSSATDFMWDTYLTREQAAKFFVKFANTLWKSDDAHKKNGFTDTRTATPDLVPFIWNAYSMWFMNWKNNKFMPFANLTQAQAVAMIIRIINWKQDETDPQWYAQYYTIANNDWLLTGLWFNYSILDSTNITRSVMALLLYRARNSAQQ